MQKSLRPMPLQTLMGGLRIREERIDRFCASLAPGLIAAALALVILLGGWAVARHVHPPPPIADPFFDALDTGIL